MIERVAVWVLTLPLMLGGSAIAHWLSYRLVYPSGGERRGVLEETGHAYLAHAPQALAVAVAAIVCAFALRVLSTRATGRAPGLALLPFALLPPGAFVVQEHLERLLHEGVVPVDAALQPTFVLGLALQSPFALVAFLLARLLLAVADRAARLGDPVPSRRRAPRSSDRPPSLPLLVPGASVLARVGAGRAPPPALARP